MKVKDFAQGFTQLMTDGYAELDVQVVVPAGALASEQLNLVLGIKNYEPTGTAPAPVVQIVAG